MVMYRRVFIRHDVLNNDSNMPAVSKFPCIKPTSAFLYIPT